MNEVIKNTRVIIVLSLFGITFILVLVFLYPDIEGIVQSELIVFLVYITLFYAIQTHKLVKEEKRKTEIELWDKRLTEFYIPFLNLLDEFECEIFSANRSIKKINDKWKKLRDIFLKKKYMISMETSEKIAMLIDIIPTYLISLRKESQQILIQQERELREIILKELNIIENDMRSTCKY